MPQLISHHLIQKVEDVPPQPAQGHSYLYGSNGTFLYIKRPEMKAIIPLAAPTVEVCGLAAVQPQLRMDIPKVPYQLVEQMMDVAMVNSLPFVETLFYFCWDGWNWSLEIPSQISTDSEVTNVEVQQSGSSYQRAIIEVHTHPPGFWNFSDKDTESTTGFRLYGILDVSPELPKLITRVGFRQCFLNVPAQLLFEGGEEQHSEQGN